MYSEAWAWLRLGACPTNNKFSSRGAILYAAFEVCLNLMAALRGRALSPLAGRETEILRVLHSQTLWLVETRTEPHSVGLTSCLHTVKPLNQQVTIRPQFLPPQHGDNFFLWFLAI